MIFACAKTGQQISFTKKTLNLICLKTPTTPISNKKLHYLTIDAQMTQNLTYRGFYLHLICDSLKCEILLRIN